MKQDIAPELRNGCKLMKLVQYEHFIKGTESTFYPLERFFLSCPEKPLREIDPSIAFAFLKKTKESTPIRGEQEDGAERSTACAVDLDELVSKIKASRFNAELWQKLFQSVYPKLVSFSSEFGDQDKIFQYILDNLPPVPNLWLSFIGKLKSSQDQNKLAIAFERGVKNTRSLELCKRCIAHVNKKTSSGAQEEQKFSNEVADAYELVLSRIGYEVDSGNIWQGYINYLRSNKFPEAYDEQRNLAKIRSTFQKAVSIPLSSVERIWTEYVAFERGLNEITAKKILLEKSLTYMTARTALHDLKALIRNISKYENVPAFTGPNMLLKSWKLLIDWEKSNPMKYEDTEICFQRLIAAYEKATIQLSECPGIWYSASDYLLELKKTDHALEVLKLGCEALPESVLLHLTYAELLESLGNSAAVYSIFDNLTESIENTVKLLSSGDEAISKEDENANQDPSGKKTPLELSKEQKSQIEDKKLCLSLVWIHYIHTARRMESIKLARAIFNKARKSLYCTYHVWVASARMEYYYNKDQATAGRIFQAGIKKFSTEKSDELGGLILHYLDFLISLNNNADVQSFFSIAFSMAESTPLAKNIWDKCIKYEVENGSLESIKKLEAGRKALFSENNDEKCEYLAEKWGMLGIDVVGRLDLKISATDDNSEEVACKLDMPISTDKKQQKRTHTLLVSVNPEKYPRPDLNVWKLAKHPQSHLTEAKYPQNPAPVMIYPAISGFLSALPPSGIYDGPKISVKDFMCILNEVQINVPLNPIIPCEMPPGINGQPHMVPILERNKVQAPEMGMQYPQPAGIMGPESMMDFPEMNQNWHLKNQFRPQNKKSSRQSKNGKRKRK